MWQTCYSILNGTLETRRKKKSLTLLYKLSHNLVDINTEEHLIPKREKRTRNSHGFKYRMPKVSKDVFKFSFFPRSITEWNSLATDLVNCTSLSDFKLNLRKYVIYLVIWTFLLLFNLCICTYIYIYIYIFFIYIYLILPFIYSWCDIQQDSINSINGDVDVDNIN